MKKKITFLVEFCRNFDENLSEFHQIKYSSRECEDCVKFYDELRQNAGRFMMIYARTLAHSDRNNSNDTVPHEPNLSTLKAACGEGAKRPAAN